MKTSTVVRAAYSVAALFATTTAFGNDSKLRVASPYVTCTLSDLIIYGDPGQSQTILTQNNPVDDFALPPGQDFIYFAGFRIKSCAISHLAGNSEMEAKFINMTYCAPTPIAQCTTWPTPSSSMVLVVDGSQIVGVQPPIGSILNVLGGIVSTQGGQQIPWMTAGTSIDLGSGVVSGVFTGQIVINGYFEVTPCSVPVFSYCTAGTTSLGCVPHLSGNGVPAASQTSGFVLNCTGAEGARSGLIFYGLFSSSFPPPMWGSSSFLCVKSPIQRTDIQSSGGTVGLCDGAVSIDWLTFMANNPGALGSPISVGSQFSAQAWYRDPPSLKTTSLSDAVTFILVP